MAEFELSHYKNIINQPDNALDLSDIREAINEVDDTLLAILECRMDLVQKVAAVKTLQSESELNLAAFTKPGREAEVIQRLLNKVSDRFFSNTIVGIWRQIISASIYEEIEFDVDVWMPEGSETAACLAREHFGAFQNVQGSDSLDDVIQSIINNPNKIGVLAEHPTFSPWWYTLKPYIKEKQLYIMAQLPLYMADIMGWAFAQFMPDQSENEETLVMVENMGDLSLVEISIQIASFYNGCGVVDSRGEEGLVTLSGRCLELEPDLISWADKNKIELIVFGVYPVLVDEYEDEEGNDDNDDEEGNDDNDDEEGNDDNDDEEGNDDDEHSIN